MPTPDLNIISRMLDGKQAISILPVKFCACSDEKKRLILVILELLEMNENVDLLRDLRGRVWQTGGDGKPLHILKGLLAPEAIETVTD